MCARNSTSLYPNQQAKHQAARAAATTLGHALFEPATLVEEWKLEVFGASRMKEKEIFQELRPLNLSIEANHWSGGLLSFAWLSLIYSLLLLLPRQ